MSQHLSAVDDPAGPPFKTRMRLTCDGKHGLLPADEFESVGSDYVAQRRAATKMGWRRCDGGIWLGPCCAKVKAKAEGDD